MPKSDWVIGTSRPTSAPGLGHTCILNLLAERFNLCLPVLNLFPLNVQYLLNPKAQSYPNSNSNLLNSGPTSA